MREKKMDVAIVIPSAGGESTLRRCVESIIRNTKTPYKIFIVDQGELGCSSYCCFLEKKYSNIFIHYNSKNEPGSKGYNRGIKSAYIKSNFTHLCFLDDDILVLKPGWLSTLADGMDTDPGVGIIGYEMCSTIPPNLGGYVLEFMSCCMLCSRELIDTIGLMDESLLWHCNDSDYCRRAWQNDFKVKVLYANDNKDMSNDFLYHSHQVGTKRCEGEKLLREKTYKVFEKKWNNVIIEAL